MARDRRRDALQTIFSFFVGLMVFAFHRRRSEHLYPVPKQEALDPGVELNNQQIRLNSKTGGPLTPAEQAESDCTGAGPTWSQKKMQAEMELWARNTFP